MLYGIKNLKQINEVFKRLNNLRRWTEFATEERYDEISKQALNCCICYILATEAEAKGVDIKWERFPIIALYRAFQKAYVNYDTPEHILRDICELGGLPFEQVFRRATFEVIAELTDEAFASTLEQGCGTAEEEIYKAATKIATLIELKEIKHNVNGDYDKKYDEVIKSMLKYEHIPGFTNLSDKDGNYFKLFSKISKLRNQNRWAAYSYRVSCSVLGHLFDTGIFAYVMALEEGLSEEIATKCFFMGIFHDIPEAFTKDIPSPIKDRIPGFRELTEKYELQMMEKNVYPLVSDEVKLALQKIMFEEEGNEEFKTLMKGADYMSAVSEIWRQRQDNQFSRAMLNHGKKFENGIAKITDSAETLYKELMGG